MDSRIINDIEIVEREACYLIDTIEQALERIVNYNDLTEEEKEYQERIAKRKENEQKELEILKKENPEEHKRKKKEYE